MMSEVRHRSVMAGERLEVTEPELSENGDKLLVTNAYATKKTLAQGMLDIALLLANTSQLNSLFSVPSENLTGTHYTLFVFLFLSLALQTVTAVLLTVLGFRSMHTTAERHRAEVLNNVVVVLIMLITIVNVFINSFNINTQNNP